MALDIDLESARELTTSELFDFFARQCDAELIDLDPRDPFLHTPGMDIRGGAEPGRDRVAA